MKLCIRLPLAAALLAGATLAATAARAEDYTIAAIKGLTNVMAFVGVPEANGIKQAVDELNAQNYLGAGNRLVLTVNDDAQDRGQMMSLVQRAVNIDKALVILGSASSPFTIALSPTINNELHIPYFGTSQTTEPLKFGPWYFKVTVGPEGAVLPVAKYAADVMHIKKPVLIWGRDNDGHINNMRIFRDYLASKGIKPIGEETILITDTDFGALATKVAAMQPDAIWAGANAVQGANLVIQLRQAGVPISTPIFGTAGLGQDYIKAGGAAVDNTYIATDFDPGAKRKLTEDFVANYKKRYGVDPDNWSAVGYSETLISAAAIKAALPNPTREKVRDAIGALHDFPTLLGNGKWNLGPDRVPVYDSPVFLIKGGKMTAVD